VHAVLHWEQGTFRLVDNGSVAGTWVNYAPVGPQGARLAHGDLIYAGRLGFRFNLREPGRQPKPVVRPYSEPEL
jgi:pSer/pThr/pTyr-binding forkhead associated (FHA) protein